MLFMQTKTTCQCTQDFKKLSHEVKYFNTRKRVYIFCKYQKVTFNYLRTDAKPPRAQGLLTEVWQRRKRQK